MSGEGVSGQVRRIAILVTSLDASAGRQLLMAMPTELARQVRRAMTQLSNVDPEEQRQILAEFRMQAMTAGESEPAKVETSAKNTTRTDPMASSTPAEVTHREQLVATRETVGNEPTHAHYGLGAVGLGALSELLRGERATVVAVVLSQLEPAQAAELLGKLPKPVQREVIVSLPRLGQIDPEAMSAIHEHLASRIADYHHRQAGESQSTSRLQELFSAAPADLRSDWQSTLYQAEPHLASRMGIAPPVPLPVSQPVAARSEGNQASMGQAQAPAKVPAAPGAKLLDLLADNVVTTADLRVADSLTNSQSEARSNVPATSNALEHIEHEEPASDRERILPFPTRPNATKAARTDSDRSMRFEQILDLPAEVIGQVLAAADTEVILFALAGASPAFMKRFMAMLDRADGRALQARLKQLKAINLKDVDAAQQKLCELASQWQVGKAAA